MFNLLIVEDDFVQAQHLINCICKSLSNIRLYNIISTAKDCIEIIKEEPSLDIIILDLNLPDKSGNSIIEYIEKNNLKEYKNSIIIRSGYIELINKIRFSPYVFSYSFKGSSTDMLINEIKRLIQEKKFKEEDYILRKKTNQLLHDLHFNFSHLGTKYLSDCICEAYTLPNKYNIILQKDLYPNIANKYNKSLHNIKSNIIKSINYMYYECDEKTLQNFLHLESISSPPTVKEFIIAGIDNLSQT